MVRKKTSKSERLLTGFELEIMNEVWRRGDCTVRDVHEGLSAHRPLAYTSVATVMKILEQKRFLHSQRNEKAHSYRALLTLEQYEATSLTHLKESVFQGNPSSMVMRLLAESEISKEDLNSIRRYLDERLKP